MTEPYEEAYKWVKAKLKGKMSDEALKVVPVILVWVCQAGAGDAYAQMLLDRHVKRQDFKAIARLLRLRDYQVTFMPIGSGMNLYRCKSEDPEINMMLEALKEGADSGRGFGDIPLESEAP